MPLEELEAERERGIVFRGCEWGGELAGVMKHPGAGANGGGQGSSVLQALQQDPDVQLVGTSTDGALWVSAGGTGRSAG